MTPIRLLEANPHYLEYRGKPTVLVTSGEHYGAVLNPDFDYVRYLDTLQSCGFNLTRLFLGTYREIPGSFGIVGNTLAPQGDRFLSPWARSDKPGYPGGGNKFDLTRFDDAFFARLKGFLGEAERRGIVVEMVLFCFLYNDELWSVNPMNAACNVNGIGAFADRDRAYSLESEALLAAQERFVRHVVTECSAFGNLYWEIMNEPYSRHDGTAFDDWQDHIAEVIVRTEKELENHHLIARNVQNRMMRVARLHPTVSIVNFHYAEPVAVAANYHLGRVIADDETGFKGQACSPYRMEAWRFMMSGGGIFSHLDYSFTAEHPDGLAPIVGESPSFGGSEWRSQLGVLKRFVEAMPFWEMEPHDEVCNLFGSQLGSGTSAHVLASPGRVYAVYLCGGSRARLGLGVPKGKYRATWVRTSDGHVVREESVSHDGNNLALVSPQYAEDIALCLRAE